MQQPAAGPSEPVPEIVAVKRTVTAAVRDTVPQADLPSFYDASFRALAQAIETQGVQITGPAFGLFHGASGDPADIEVGFPTDRPIEPDGGVAPGALPGGRVVRMVHAGAFDGLPASWARLFAWVGEQSLNPAPLQWEVYLTEPSPDMNPDDLRVELNLPVEG
ncbi:GyrI-like domain-containing protein [Streptomonospora algeriensis]|uniref:GyrI-like domain-containing protein n=1 Tax=Streptomonospora algeriensis TaxID=995084 RepID=A0ABW3BCK6_9ACTN